MIDADLTVRPRATLAARLIVRPDRAAGWLEASEYLADLPQRRKGRKVAQSGMATQWKPAFLCVPLRPLRLCGEIATI